jgi:hypothetical protein
LSNLVETVDCEEAAKVMRFALYHVEEKNKFDDEEEEEEEEEKVEDEVEFDVLRSDKKATVLGKRSTDDNDAPVGDENDGNTNNHDVGNTNNKRARVALSKALADNKRSSPQDKRMERFRHAMSEQFQIKGDGQPITPAEILGSVNKRLSKDGGQRDHDEELYTSPEAMKLIKVC